MARPIYLVSGLPRSGTSMMMRMLHAGGLEPLVDGVREADEDNPRGYYELEAVKATARDASWLARAEGKVVKVISQLLRDLPADRRYKVIFMRRNLDEILASQAKMLERRGEPRGDDDDAMKTRFAAHVAEVERWLRDAGHVEALYVSYNRMLADPRPLAERIAAFVDAALDVEQMVRAVEPSLYRQRR